MVNSKRYIYLVEGETEKKLIHFLITEMNYIQPGKIKKFNLFQTPITNAFLSTISQRTTIIVVFDTDLLNPNKKLFDKNLEKLRNSKNVNQIILIPQITNLEDEIVYCTKIKKIEDFFNSETVEKFKAELLRISNKNLFTKFKLNNLDIYKLWTRCSTNAYYCCYENESDKIKLK